MKAAQYRHSLEGHQEATGDRATGFDFLRIVLALAVFALHVPDLTALEKSGQSFFTNLGGVILPMFFALSGYLVAGSLDRCRTLAGFLGLRIIRIIPALAVEVLLSALIVGPLFTNLPLTTYFADPQFWRYLLNITGEIHYSLPGVFENAPIFTAVNGQLWTIPYELACYVVLAALAVFGARRWTTLSTLAVVGFVVLFFLQRAARKGLTAEMVAVHPGLMLIWTFMVGVALYHQRSIVRWSWPIAAVSAAVSIVALEVDGYGQYVLPFSSAYLTVYVGLTKVRMPCWLRGADYSYGIYLYHFVIIQAVLQMLPRTTWMIAAVALPVTVLFAGLSWHIVEKPLLTMRHPLLAADKKGQGWPLQAAVIACFVIGGSWAIAKLAS